MKNKKIVIGLIAISIIVVGITISAIGKQHTNNITNVRTVYISQNGPSCISGAVSDALILEYSIALSSKSIAMANHTKRLSIDRVFHSQSVKIPNSRCDQETGLCISSTGVISFGFEIDTKTLSNGLHELKILNNDGSIFTSILIFIQN